MYHKQQLKEVEKMIFDDEDEEIEEENVKLCKECGYQLFPEDIVCPNCKTERDNAEILEAAFFSGNTNPEKYFYKESETDRQIKQLQSIAILRKDEILTEEEFQIMKERIISDRKNLNK